ncbi:GNAT family N-acetyltransferase [Paracoccus stylophorae]|uniref:GNAT family N-acetyltransferase n=1 Tax=Paracoccus stylophorae TaxID=659350 RepID=A0ABY7SW71_9RHOB|nr:GNAT family N-acetyltransferase [Paracoccus stylophorae]WCR10446.1 GNAT family N-acetyltransferase [Paracoccus stylophorae]
MTPAELAALHAACFTRDPRPWREAEFQAILQTQGSFLLHRPGGFLIGRVIADEAELLTLAVAAARRRRGLGRELTRDFAATSRRRGAASAFLEVAADNLAARALYASLGWREAGFRRNYYGAGRDGLVLRLGL